MPLQVGQKLWFVPKNGSGTPHEVTVEKIGRKWASIGRRGRINLETLAVDGGEYSSPGQCYEDRAAYETKVELQAAWSSLQNKFRYQWAVPDGVTMDAIRGVYSAMFPSDQ